MDKRWLVIAVISLYFMSPVRSEVQDSIPEIIQNIQESKIVRTLEKVSDFLNNPDTNYVSHNRSNFPGKHQSNNLSEHYKLASKEEDKQSLAFSPTMHVKLGGYFGYKWLLVGWSFDVANKKATEKRKEFSLSINTAALGFDFFHRKGGRDFKISDIKNIDLGNSSDYDKKFTGMTAKVTGADLYWIFNNKKYSYPAAFAQSTQQLKSAGSLISGISYSRHVLDLDTEQLPRNILEALDPSLRIEKLSYSNYTIHTGYAYNWVFAKNWLAAASFSPAVALKSARVHTIDDSNHHLDLNIDFIIRAGIVYNNSRFFAGGDFMMNTYKYSSDQIAFNNRFGSARVYGGINFGLKKKYKGGN